MELIMIDNQHGYVKKESVNEISIETHVGNEEIKIDKNELNGRELIVGKHSIDDNLIGIINYQEIDYYIHVKSNNIYCTPYINGDSEGSINLKIKLLHSRFNTIKTKYSYLILDNVTKEKYKLDSILFLTGDRDYINLAPREKSEPNIYLKIKYGNYISFLEYTIKKQNISLKTVNYSTYNNKYIQLDFKSANQLIIKINGIYEEIKIHKLIKKKCIKLNDKLTETLKTPIFLRIQKRLFVIDINKDDKKVYIYYNKIKIFLIKNTSYRVTTNKRFLIVKGKIDYIVKPDITYLMTNKGKILGRIKWVDNKRFYVKIKKENLVNLSDIHTTLQLSIGTESIHKLPWVNKNDEMKKRILSSTIYKERVIIVRINLANNMSVSIIPKSPMYTKWNKLKIKFSYILSFLISPFIRRNLNLYFEKEASRAVESATYVFESVVEHHNFNSINKFILDKDSLQYNKMKRKWKNKVITRFSFFHFLYIFLADNFISSELSNHVISTRVFNNELNIKIKKTPLYFLQHGIMFAKPVDNPMALGFHKKNMSVNVVKSVISSDLEAGEFYKMGYSNEDLMKTGLPKLDGAKLNRNADKITFMPTWRYWEESTIMNGNIKETTYYKTFIDIIKAFEKADLIDRLQITSHFKFVEYIEENMSDYKHILCNDPTDALKNSCIFITDYSSIIYDAIYRGTFPIFYWKDSDYLIKKYQATPPVNEHNAPGVIVKSTGELINVVKESIENNYTISSETIEKYRKINEFYDNKNTERVIKELNRAKVL